MVRLQEREGHDQAWVARAKAGGLPRCAPWPAAASRSGASNPLTAIQFSLFELNILDIQDGSGICCLSRLTSKEVRLYASPAERERFFKIKARLDCRLDKLANVFAILRTLEFLEMSYARNILKDDECALPRLPFPGIALHSPWSDTRYEAECNRLLLQHKVRIPVVPNRRRHSMRCGLTWAMSNPSPRNMECVMLLGQTFQSPFRLLSAASVCQRAAADQGWGSRHRQVPRCVQTLRTAHFSGPGREGGRRQDCRVSRSGLHHFPLVLSAFCPWLCFARILLWHVHGSSWSPSWTLSASIAGPRTR